MVSPCVSGSFAAIAGYPHLTVPMGAVKGLPVGLSFIGNFLKMMFRMTEVEYKPNAVLERALNILWILIFGWEIAVAHLVFGLLLCVTIIGIPFGMQHFKLAKLALIPFGARIYSI